MFQLNSSLRVRPASETFRIAQSFFKKLGISRVTETTRLDRIGLPVAVAIRPTATKGSLIVTAGKGIKPIDAMTGAAMESIELAFSEPKHSSLHSEFLPAQRILNSNIQPEDILRLCPILGSEIDLKANMSMVLVEEVISNKKKFIPSELLFIPFVPQKDEMKYFGFHTNGLASGNCYEEAVIHAILEVIERDILSFEFVKENASIVDLSTLPTQAQKLIFQIQSEGLKVVVKTIFSPHNIPFFKVYILDKWAANPTNLNAGYGCHCKSEIALMRALSEAAQSRMSYIHGGREDLTKGYQNFNRPGSQKKDFDKMYFNLMDADEIPFKQVLSLEFPVQSIKEYLSCLAKQIQQNGVIKEIYVARHTALELPLQVVKVVIPDMEFYNPETNRVGPRLQQFIKSLVV